MPVFIAHDGAWYEGSVLAVQASDGYLIHYDGWDAGSDEVVDESRLRLREVAVVNWNTKLTPTRQWPEKTSSPGRG